MWNELRLPQGGNGGRLIRVLRRLIVDHDLTRGELLVAGSARLWAEGVLPDLHDLDIVATGRSLYTLETLALSEGSFAKGEYSDQQVMRLHGGDIEVAGSWVDPVAAMDELTAECEVIEGLQFMSLQQVIAYKAHLGRYKDRVHLNALFRLSGLGRRHGARPIGGIVPTGAEGSDTDPRDAPLLLSARSAAVTPLG